MDRRTVDREPINVLIAITSSNLTGAEVIAEPVYAREGAGKAPPDAAAARAPRRSIS